MSSSGSNSALIRAMPAVFVLIWSTGFIVAKYGLPYAPPLTFLAIRYVLSLACFLVWIAIARVAWPRSRVQWLHLGVTGILIHAGYLGGVWSAIKGGMGSGLSALIVGLQPVLTAVWVSRMGDASQSDNRVSARQWLGLVLGLAGLLLVVSRKFGAGNEATAYTLACAVFALLSITIGTLYQKRFVQAADVRSANAIQLGAALLVTLPFAWFEAEPVLLTPEFMGALAWSVLALTLGGSSLLYMLIQRGAATAVTSLLYLVPPTTALMAWLLFGESITVVTVLGTALTALGVWLVVRNGTRAA
ncbi:MAG: DMT family transporter [Polaromonas sp.]|uniref:DMT family transporter n=2 Tax=Polaromonas sp. TaxID=1869339 RepID=UPI002489AF0F|nr:DMT family transporter [Polaromonas sp.]MDI1270567.1 DMT family transporter [Polaromonas sp.]MDO9113270.1 DMT family transporter [Polaromonas sp.]MDP1889111.1 DMT family transporter [Polaromonas sp.]MDP2448438.1 DMT family transporter [Polaromonas sp.]MDP3249323.1 DMT family transporter [Polaromonas sp.]